MNYQLFNVHIDLSRPIHVHAEFIDVLSYNGIIQFIRATLQYTACQTRQYIMHSSVLRLPVYTSRSHRRIIYRPDHVTN